MKSLRRQDTRALTVAGDLAVDGGDEPVEQLGVQRLGQRIARLRRRTRIQMLKDLLPAHDDRARCQRVHQALRLNLWQNQGFGPTWEVNRLYIPLSVRGLAQRGLVSACDGKAVSFGVTL